MIKAPIIVCNEMPLEYNFDMVEYWISYTLDEYEDYPS